MVSDRKLILNAELGSYTEEVTMMCFYCLNCCMYVMRHMNRISSLELNPLPPKYKAGALTCEPQRSLVCHYEHSCVEFHSTFAVLTVFPPHNSSIHCEMCIYWLVLKQYKNCIVADSQCKNAALQKGARLCIWFLLL